MTTRNPRTAGILAVALLLALSASGQMIMEHCCPALPEYDSTTEVTLMATVREVVEHQGHQGWVGIHLRVMAEGESLEVHLGPSLYLLEQRWAAKEGERMQITGSKVEVEGGHIVIARTIRKNGWTLVLRNEQGVPEWSEGGERLG